MREARYRGFGQPTAAREVLIAEHAFAVPKAGQQLKSPRERRDEVSICLAQGRIGDRAGDFEAFYAIGFA
jgi:hypothetical protein